MIIAENLLRVVTHGYLADLRDQLQQIGFDVRQRRILEVFPSRAKFQSAGCLIGSNATFVETLRSDISDVPLCPPISCCKYQAVHGLMMCVPSDRYGCNEASGTSG